MSGLVQGPVHVARGETEEMTVGTWVRETAFVLVVALVISTLVRLFLVQMYWIPSPSMESTLMRNDRIAVSRISGWTGDIERGDVVVFNDSLGWLDREESTGIVGVLQDFGEFIGLLPANGEQSLVKRVMAVGGDHIRCCTVDGRIEVNGVPIDEPWLDPGVEPSQIPFDVVVPEGTVWVMGDNRANSSDSRLHRVGGQVPFVPVSDIVGRAVAVVWPIDRWSTLPGRSAFEDVPDGQ